MIEGIAPKDAEIGMTRRRVLGGAFGGALAGSLVGSSVAAKSTLIATSPEPSVPHPKKAVKIGMVAIAGSLEDKFRALASLGFDGVEMDSPNDLDPAEVVAARDATGLAIPGVVDSVHWSKPFSHPDAKVREQGVRALEIALRDAAAYGATSVLVVPAVVSKEVSYADAYRRSQSEIRKVLPLARELGVRIAFENVWNNFLLSPLEMARYVDEFEDPLVGVHLDPGNLVRFGWPEHWIEVLGARILKMDVKDYSRKRQLEEGLWKGFEVEIGDGDTDWPKVVAAARAIGYEGWYTAEVAGGGVERLRVIHERMTRFLG